MSKPIPTPPPVKPPEPGTIGDMIDPAVRAALLNLGRRS